MKQDIPQNKKTVKKFFKHSEDKQTKTRHVSFFASSHRHLFGKELEDKPGKTKQFSIFKKNHKTLFRKKLEDKEANPKPVSIVQTLSKEAKLDSSKLKKLKSQRHLMDRIRKRERFSVEDDFELFDESFLQSLMLMKSRIIKKPIKNQRYLEEKFQPDQKETHRTIKKEAYQLNQEELCLLNQMETDQRFLEATNQPKIQENKVISNVEKTNLKLFKVNQNFKDDRKEKPTDMAKAVETSFDTGEQILKLINLNASTQKIDLDHFSQLSEWSDWKYEWPISKEVVQPTETKKSTNHRLYVFLPPVLNPMLRFGKTNIISRANIQNDSDNICSVAFNPEIKRKFLFKSNLIYLNCI